MNQLPDTVKQIRSYDGTRRRERAQQLRAATLDAARLRFLDSGYAATTIESIADAAGISAATIYKSYGGKSGLVRALCELALEGAGPVPAETRSDALRVKTDARSVIAGWGRLTAEVAPRVAPLLLLLRDAARLDPEAAALHGELDRKRLRRMDDNARYLAAAGHLRPGVSARDARDTLWLYSSPDLYDLLVGQRGWSVAKYSRFVAKSMTDALL